MGLRVLRFQEWIVLSQHAAKRMGSADGDLRVVMDVKGACYQYCEQVADAGDKETEANETEYTKRLAGEAENTFDG